MTIFTGGADATGTGISRRTVLGGMGATLGATALRGYGVQADEPAHFTHGVASGDPLSDRVVIWTRVIPGDGTSNRLDVRWQVSRDTAFTKIAAEGTTFTNRQRDFTVKIDARGLEPRTRYYYRFIAEGVTSITGRTLTLPDENLDAVKMAVVSCSNYPQGYFHIYKEIAKRPVQLVLHLGDYIYEYEEGKYADKAILKKGRNVKPPHEIIKLEDYRMRYGLYRSDPDLQAVHAAHPFICVWDDHEIANDTWVDGAENHNEGDGPFEARKKAAIQAYREWLPIRDDRPSMEGAPDGQIYRRFDIGILASLIMLDTRLIGRTKGLDYQTDLPMRQIPFDFSDPEAPKAVLDPSALADLPAAAIRQITVPFDMRDGTPKPVTDWPTLQGLDPKALPQGFAYLPDTDTFRKGILGDENRTMLGETQEDWLADTLQASRDKGIPWQILGQQVLMGKVGMPLLREEDFDFSRPSFVKPDLVGTLQFLARAQMPFNLDAWDGYPAARERVFDLIKAHANNAVVLAGDTHNAWAFNMKDKDGAPVAVEFGTASVSSPGLESYLPVSGERMSDALHAASPELAYTQTTHRGWMEMTLTPSEAITQWFFINTVKEERYALVPGAIAVTKAGAHEMTVKPIV
ncbi:alkaline phosphatase D family protein [Eilatimonas milleporae]|uniref:Alkaline phosphatase D n=1 Tax=Eilatimonas milleporae TaxID=911205 RepID=A0A3M0C4U9_9PROT|nr:alkaline phosphatase D family protein [Eilatimonas milleporae]RMB04844.1 alkaline phosphatase D [Eilatimonas milleporae]